MATAMKSKPSAYEKGVREGAAIRKQAEAKGQEMESPEEEEMDGEPKLPGHGPYSKTNRKRSAKGAKNTKAPMDGGMYGKKPMDAECGCMSKGRKGKCDGSCGKKMDALTPQEYLTACELGIQGRTRPYIRARLDTDTRADLKCGNGSISEGEKCTKGTAQKVDPNAKYSIKGRAKAEAKRGAIGGAIGGAAGGFLAGAFVQRGGIKAGLAQAALGAGVGAAYGAVAGASRGAAGAAANRTGRAFSRNRQNIKNSNQEIKSWWQSKGEQQYNQANQSKDRNKINKVAIKQAGQIDRILNKNSTQIWTNANRSWASVDRARGKRDSIYADGFSPDLMALAI